MTTCSFFPLFPRKPATLLHLLPASMSVCCLGSGLFYVLANSSLIARPVKLTSLTEDAHL